MLELKRGKLNLFEYQINERSTQNLVNPSFVEYLKTNTKPDDTIFSQCCKKIGFVETKNLREQIRILRKVLISVDEFYRKEGTHTYVGYCKGIQLFGDQTAVSNFYCKMREYLSLNGVKFADLSLRSESRCNDLTPIQNVILFTDSDNRINTLTELVKEDLLWCNPKRIQAFSTPCMTFSFISPDVKFKSNITSINQIHVDIEIYNEYDISTINELILSA